MFEPGFADRINNHSVREYVGARRRALPRKWWLSVALFALTLVTTTVFGFSLDRCFAAGHGLDVDSVLEGYAALIRGDWVILSGLQFSLPLLSILLSHEFAHYIEARRWNVDASLPYFLPSPTLFGTLGAFIRIRSPIYSRRGLFDIGIAGPLVGFVVLVPFLVFGVSMSRVTLAAAQGSVVFGTPLIMRLLEQLRFPGVAPAHIMLHPAAMAAWGGLLATAINLLPMGQLDGGHILYAMCGARWHRIMSLSLVAVLTLLGFLYWAWWVWAFLMLLVGRRHPLVYDHTPLSWRRIALSVVALLVFVLSISVVPVRTL